MDEREEIDDGDYHCREDCVHIRRSGERYWTFTFDGPKTCKTKKTESRPNWQVSQDSSNLDFEAMRHEKVTGERGKPLMLQRGGISKNELGTGVK